MAKKKITHRKTFKIAPPTPNLLINGRPLNSKNAAKYLGISRNTLFKRCIENLITYFVNGNAFEFYTVHLDDYKHRCCRNG